MRERLRGYAAGLLQASSSPSRVGEDLEAFLGLLNSSPELSNVLGDGAIPAEMRRAVVEELVGPRVSPDARKLLSYALGNEHPEELRPSLAALAVEASHLDPGGLIEAPMVSKGTVRERVAGYADFVFQVLVERDGVGAIDAVEDDLFRLARITEAHPSLALALGDPGVPVQRRRDLVADLLANKAHWGTVDLVKGAVWAGRVRDLAGLFDWLSEMAAAERGRRVAKVRSAQEIDEDQRQALGSALSALTGNTVELQVVVDPFLLGGLQVRVGDTVIDATLRRRLERLRETLLAPEAMADLFARVQGAPAQAGNVPTGSGDRVVEEGQSRDEGRDDG
jgi:F-type H+-transporting ATPase subunit delta